MTEEKLNQLREKINELDAQILEILTERMKCSLEVGKTKKEMEMPIFDPQREADHLSELVQAGAREGISEVFIRMLWAQIMEESRRVQNEH